MKVIYVHERRHVYKHDRDMMGYDSFRVHNIEIEAWSAVNWTFKDIDVPMPVNADNSNYVHYITNERTLQEELDRLKKTGEKCLFICYPYHAYNKVSFQIRKNIKEYGYEFCNKTETPTIEQIEYVDHLNYFQIFILELGRFGSIVLNLFKFLLSFGANEKAKSIVSYRFYSFWGPILYKSKYNLVTVLFEKRTFPNLYEMNSRRNCLIHADSYDEYLKSLKHDKLVRGEYIVFVDDYLVGHSDFIKNGQLMPVANPQKYFKQINKLFSSIEKIYKAKVIIAAHPKSEYHGNEFGKREIIKGETNILIRYAKLVIMEVSTCLNLIALNKKNFFVIYTKEILERAPELKQVYDEIQKKFSCQKLDLYNEDEINKFQEYICHYDKAVYDEFIKKMIKSKNSEGGDHLFYDIVYRKVILNK